MTKATFITASGQQIETDGPNGQSLMRVATAAQVPGIIGECGGSCACGTCHVYVDAGWLDQLPPAGEGELDVLDGVAAPQANSRLSCQIVLTPALAGLVLNVPPESA